MDASSIFLKSHGEFHLVGVGKGETSGIADLIFIGDAETRLFLELLSRPFYEPPTKKHYLASESGICDFLSEIYNVSLVRSYPDDAIPVMHKRRGKLRFSETIFSHPELGDYKRYRFYNSAGQILVSLQIQKNGDVSWLKKEANTTVSLIDNDSDRDYEWMEFEFSDHEVEIYNIKDLWEIQLEPNERHDAYNKMLEERLKDVKKNISEVQEKLEP